MHGKPPGPLVLGVLAALQEHHELTRAEICRIMGTSRFLASSVISRLNRELPTLPKRIYVVRWVHDDDTAARNYPRAVYALGNLPDAKKPKPKPAKENSRRWREKERNQVNSVFMWAQPRRVRAAVRRGEVDV